MSDVPYVAKSVRAAQAIKANPKRSDRAIAEEIGVSRMTVGRAREESSVPDVTERIRSEGRSFAVRQRVTEDPDIGAR